MKEDKGSYSKEKRSCQSLIHAASALIDTSRPCLHASTLTANSVSTTGVREIPLAQCVDSKMIMVEAPLNLLEDLHVHKTKN